MKTRSVWGFLLRVAISTLCAGIFYFAWLASFLVLIKLGGPVVRAVLSAMAPVVTAIGYTVGLVAGERLTNVRGNGFWRTLVWPLVGCAIGAGVGYQFGPMLIVFGMFVAGTATVAIREAVRFCGRDRI